MWEDSLAATKTMLCSWTDGRGFNTVRHNQGNFVRRGCVTSLGGGGGYVEASPYLSRRISRQEKMGFAFVANYRQQAYFADPSGWSMQYYCCCIAKIPGKVCEGIKLSFVVWEASCVHRLF